jgi:zinc transporter ZupT
VIAPAGTSILVVLGYAALSAAASALGAVPAALFGSGRRHALPAAWIGWANALAAGMMLGAAYVLAETGRESPAVPAALGAALGVLFIYGTHRALGTGAGPLDDGRPGDPRYGRKIVLVNALHSASEGVAIGAAFAVDVRFGIFLALAIAVHNVPESTVLCSVLAARGVRLAPAGALAVAADLGQVLLAVASFALISAAPAALPWALGFATGALINLVLMELLPESYRQAGHTSIALVASVAMGIVVLLEGVAL